MPARAKNFIIDVYYTRTKQGKTMTGINKTQAAPSFGKFIKIKDCTKKEVHDFRKNLNHKSEDFLTLAVKDEKDTKGEKRILYLFSDKYLDKFLEKIQGSMSEFRRNVEYYMGEKPKEMSLKKAYKKLID